MVKPGAMPAAKDSSQPLVTALLRGLEVLRCFGYGRDTLGSSDIARLTGLPQPTVWRICKTLESEGYLVAEQGGTRYRPGLSVLTLGYAALHTLDIAALSAPPLQQMANQVRGTAGLSTREKLSMLFLQRNEANDAVLNFNMRAGTGVSMAISASGWAYLSLVTPAERKALWAELAADDAAQAREGQKAFKAAHAGFEKTGYVVNSDVLFPGLSSVAVPFRPSKREGIYVVSCSAMTAVFGTPELHLQAGQSLLRIAAQLAQV